MPKQVLTINDFSGGLNNHSDPRDIDDNQFSTLTGAQLSKAGVIRFVGGEKSSDAKASIVGAGTIASGDIGSGTYAFSTDYDSSSNPNPTDWLVYHSSSDGKLELWDGTNVITIDMTATGDNPSFYDVDGILRYSDTGLGAVSKQYGFIDDDLFLNTSGTYLSPRSEWLETTQDLNSFSDLSITFALYDSSTSNPSSSEITGSSKIILAYSKYSQNRGKWTGVYEFGIAPVYKGGQEGVLEEIDGTVQLYKHKMSFKLYICSGTVTSIAEDADSVLGDDRIVGVNIYFRRHSEKDWYLLKEFDLIKGEPYNWDAYDSSTDTAKGIWGGSLSIAMKSGASLDQFKDSTVNITYHLTGSMDSTRSGFLRVFGFLVNPVYLELPAGTSAGQFSHTSSNIIEVSVKNPEIGTREVYCQILDEELNVVKESTKTEVTFVEGTVSAPSTEGGANNAEEDQEQMQCFLANTKILMSSGELKNIQDIKVGDIVSSHYKGDYVSGVVTDSLIHPVYDVVDVAVVNNKLYSTANHPVMLNGVWSEIQYSGLNININKMFVDVFYNLEIDGNNVFGSEHNFIADGYIVSGLGDNDVLNKVMPRQNMFKKESLNA